MAEYVKHYVVKSICHTSSFRPCLYMDEPGGLAAIDHNMSCFNLWHLQAVALSEAQFPGSLR